MLTVANAYLETQVLTASPERLHLMVVDAAIRFARQGELAIEARNYETAFQALDRSRSCVNEILVGINRDPNPELAERLKALFLFVHRNLVQADLHKDAQRVRDALGILESHRQTWLELIGRLAEGKAHAGGARAEGAPENDWST